MCDTILCSQGMHKCFVCTMKEFDISKGSKSFTLRLKYIWSSQDVSIACAGLHVSKISDLTTKYKLHCGERHNDELCVCGGENCTELMFVLAGLPMELYV